MTGCGAGDGGGRRRHSRIVALVVVAVVSVVSALALAGSPRLDDGETGGVLYREGDLVVMGAKPGTATAPAATGDGYAIFRDATLLDQYTIHLQRSPGIEILRPLLVDAAITIGLETGLPLTLAPGTVDAPVEARRVIDVVISSSSVCSGSWLGCTSPEVHAGKIRRARVWINPRLFDRSADVIGNTVRHELGHALGLAHYDARHAGEIQIMHSARFDASDYRRGDIAGIVHLRGDSPITTVAPTTPATTIAPTTASPTTAPPTTVPPAPPTTVPLAPAPAPAPATMAPPPSPEPVPTIAAPSSPGVTVNPSSSGAGELATLGLTAPQTGTVEGTGAGPLDGPTSVAVMLLVAVWSAVLLRARGLHS